MSKSKRPNNFNMEIMRGTGQELKRYRNLNKITQKQASEWLGISDETLSNYENGKVAIPFDTILALCIRYGARKIIFSPSTEKPEAETTLQIAPVGIKEIENELSRYDKGLVNNIIYEYIDTILKYEPDPTGRKILRLYLDYCKDLVDEDGNKICANAVMKIDAREKQAYSVDVSLDDPFKNLEKLLNPDAPPPSTRETDIGELYVGVKASH